MYELSFLTLLARFLLLTFRIRPPNLQSVFPLPDSPDVFIPGILLRCFVILLEPLFMLGAEGSVLNTRQPQSVTSLAMAALRAVRVSVEAGVRTM